jgi:hypothetical protein
VVLIIEHISLKRHISPANSKERNFIISGPDSILAILRPRKGSTNTNLIRKLCILRKEKSIPRTQISSIVSIKAIGHINDLEIKTS